MDKECYKDIEKIKTIGSTYMAAVGLVPTIGTKVGFHFCYVVVFFLNLSLIHVILLNEAHHLGEYEELTPPCLTSSGQKISL